MRKLNLSEKQIINESTIDEIRKLDFSLLKGIYDKETLDRYFSLHKKVTMFKNIVVEYLELEPSELGDPFGSYLIENRKKLNEIYYVTSLVEIYNDLPQSVLLCFVALLPFSMRDIEKKLDEDTIKDIVDFYPKAIEYMDSATREQRLIQLISVDKFDIYSLESRQIRSKYKITLDELLEKALELFEKGYISVGTFSKFQYNYNFKNSSIIRELRTSKKELFNSNYRKFRELENSPNK